MLCDEIVGSKYFAHLQPTKQSALNDRISQAQKFVLDRDFCLAADQVANDTTSLEKALPFCRLPYSDVWIEYSIRDRPSAFDSIPFGRRDEWPMRIGYLISTASCEIPAYKVHLFWCAHGKDHEAMSEAAMIFDPMRTGFAFDGIDDASARATMDRMTKHHGNLPGVFAYIGTDFHDDFFDILTKRVSLAEGYIKGQDVMWNFIKTGMECWSVEGAYLCAVLALLNSKNLSKPNFIDNSKLNRARVKAKKPPYFSYHVCKINIGRLSSVSHRNGDSGHNEIRAHFVRGHFKMRTSGVFWWSPFVRGKLKHGFVEKSYQVAR